MSRELSREFAYNTGKFKEFKAKVWAPADGVRKGKKNLSAFHLLTKLI